MAGSWGWRRGSGCGNERSAHAPGGRFLERAGHLGRGEADEDTAIDINGGHAATRVDAAHGGGGVAVLLDIAVVERNAALLEIPARLLAVRTPGGAIDDDGDAVNVRVAL